VGLAFFDSEISAAEKVQMATALSKSGEDSPEPPVESPNESIGSQLALSHFLSSRQTPRSFLQQALPTPKISSGPAFYKRKLWTYNFCIHDTGSDNASMFVWPETIPGRGSHEMASCVLQYFKNTEVKAQTLHVYSDNCSGQNKNFNILSLWQYLVANGSFKEIRHIFPLSGHTMMPCDRDFGDIERKLQKKQVHLHAIRVRESHQRCSCKKQISGY